MADPIVPAAPVAPDAPAAAPAPAQDVALAAPKPEAPKPKTLPYARPSKPEPAPIAAAPAVDAPRPDSKPAPNRAAAMQRARANALAAELEAMKKAASSVDSMRKVLAGYADDAVNPLSKEWQDHLREIAGDDPERLLNLVRKTARLREAAAPAPPAPAPKLPSTAPAQGAPGSPAVDADVATLAQYEQLKRDGRMLVAAQFAERNRAAIARGEMKRAPKN